MSTPLAGWQSGHAAACKAVYAGSIPTSASKVLNRRPDDEIGRRKGLKIPGRKACRFDSGSGHQKNGHAQACYFFGDPKHSPVDCAGRKLEREFMVRAPCRVDDNRLCAIITKLFACKQIAGGS